MLLIGRLYCVTRFGHAHCKRGLGFVFSAVMDKRLGLWGARLDYLWVVPTGWCSSNDASYCPCLVISSGVVSSACDQYWSRRHAYRGICPVYVYLELALDNIL